MVEVDPLETRRNAGFRRKHQHRIAPVERIHRLVGERQHTIAQHDQFVRCRDEATQGARHGNDVKLGACRFHLMLQTDQARAEVFGQADDPLAAERERQFDLAPGDRLARERDEGPVALTRFTGAIEHGKEGDAHPEGSLKFELKFEAPL